MKERGRKSATRLSVWLISCISCQDVKGKRWWSWWRWSWHIILLHLLLPPRWLCDSQFDCEQNNMKSYVRIWMTFSGNVEPGECILIMFWILHSDQIISIWYNQGKLIFLIFLSFNQKQKDWNSTPQCLISLIISPHQYLLSLILFFYQCCAAKLSKQGISYSVKSPYYLINIKTSTLLSCGIKHSKTVTVCTKTRCV